MQQNTAKYLTMIAQACFLVLMIDILLWEGAFSPSSPNHAGVVLTLKIIPLLALLRGILTGRASILMYATLVMLMYFTESIMVAWSMRSAGWVLTSPLPWAVTEFILSTLFIVTGGLAARAGFLALKQPSS